jgi:transposase
MSNPIILPSNFDSYNFISLARTEKNPKNRIRLIAMANIKEGKTLEQISELLKIHWKTIQSWLRSFRKHGINGLFVKATKDKPNKLSKEAEEWIRSFLTSLSNSDTGGYITGKQLQSIVMTKFSTKCCLRTIYNTLHRLNFSWISSRSKHPKSDLEVQELYKKFCAIANRTDTTTC